MKNLKINLLVFAMTLFFISCEKEDVISAEPSISTEVLNASSEVEKITFDNGTQVSFYKIDDGNMKGVFLLEEADCGDCSAVNAVSILAKKELTEQEMFWALSNPGTIVPEFLKEINNTKSAMIKPQGWGRNAINKLSDTEQKMATIACNNNSFTSSIAYGFIGNPEFIRLDKTPNNYAPFVNDCANLGPVGCDNGQKYRYTATFSGINRWKGKICSRAVQNSTNNHMTKYFCDQPVLCTTYVGPELYFEYLSNGVWRSMKKNFPPGFEVPANTVKSYTYSWRTNSNTSFRLRVRNAMGKDQFDFMMDK